VRSAARSPDMHGVDRSVRTLSTKACAHLDPTTVDHS
jgi:hypothetical protein